MPSLSTFALMSLARLGAAKQDARIIFGETVEIAPGHTSTPVLHSPGPATRATLQDCRDEIQRHANGLAEHGPCHAEALAVLIAAAECEHAEWPQYRGHWDDYGLAVARKAIRTKMGTACEKGDVVLYTPARHGDPDREGFYSLRNGIDTAPTRDALRPVAATV